MTPSFLSVAVLSYLIHVVFLNNIGFYGTCPAAAALAVCAAPSFPLLSLAVLFFQYNKIFVNISALMVHFPPRRR